MEELQRILDAIERLEAKVDSVINRRKKDLERKARPKSERQQLRGRAKEFLGRYEHEWDKHVHPMLLKWERWWKLDAVPESRRVDQAMFVLDYEHQVSELEKAFVGADILHYFGRLYVWEETHPHKTPMGRYKSIASWIGRSIDQGKVQTSSPSTERPLGPPRWIPDGAKWLEPGRRLTIRTPTDAVIERQVGPWGGYATPMGVFTFAWDEGEEVDVLYEKNGEP